MKCSICEFESENVCDFRIFHEIETLNPMLIMLKFLCKKCGQTMLVGPVKEKIPLGSRRVAPDGTPEIYVKKVADKESGRVEKTCDNCAEKSEGRCPGHPAGVCGERACVAWEAETPQPLPPGYKVLSRETFVKEEFVVYVGEPDPKGFGVSMSEHLQDMLSVDIRITKTDYIESGRYYAVHGTRTYKAGE